MRGLNPRALILTGGVGAAANLLNISQPAVSRMIRDFQQDLGLSLFERRGTRLVPTSDALSLYAEVERAFIGLDRIAKTATELRTRRAGFLRIAALPALANGFLPRFAGQFAAERPKLDLGVSGLVSHAVVAAVAQGQSDLGFAEASIEHAAVQAERMPAAPYVAVLPRGHRLARKKRLRPEDFAGESFVSLGHSSLSRFRIDRVFAEHGVERILRIETPLSEIACSLVASGAGVSLCEPFTASEYATRGIVVRPLEPRIEFEYAALYPAAQRTPLLVRQFIDGFRAHVAAFLRREAWRAPS
jgi:DNA-binding transcriptional LysR family regulator